MQVEEYSSTQELEIRQQKSDLFKACPIPDDEILNNLGVFLSSKNLARILFFNHLYEKIIEVNGSIIEFGTRWGNNISILAALRGIYEPFNRLRTIVAFDTFQGLSECLPQDQNSPGAPRSFQEGDLSVTAGYEKYLSRFMGLHEADNPMAHLKKYEIIKGDATETFARYLHDHRELIVALAFFDMDIYQPTKECLGLLKKRLVRGSVIGFDELNDPMAPGETQALDEVFGLNNIRLKRYRHASRVSYFVVE